MISSLMKLQHSSLSSTSFFTRKISKLLLPSSQLSTQPLCGSIPLKNFTSSLAASTEPTLSSLDKYGRKYPPKKGNYLVPSIAVDAVVARPSKLGQGLEILMITRKNEPFKGRFAFPGGYLDYNESPQDGCLRELKEETSLEGNNCRLLDVRGEPNRDPREHIVSIFYLVNVPEGAEPVAADDAATAKFYLLSDLLQAKETIAFDHFQILEKILPQQKL